MSTGTLTPPFVTALATYASWAFFFLFGHLRDLFRKQADDVRAQKCAQGYAPIRQDYEDFYTRRMYYRVHDCFNRPLASAPDAYIDVLLRTDPDADRPLLPTGKIRRCLNLGSYNYLGFAAADEYCTPQVLATLNMLGWSMCSSRTDAGTTPVHVELEELVADFVGKEAAITYNMGFATNSLVIPVLMGEQCLILSDSLNHASIVAGARASGAKIQVFAHNDMEHLELLLRSAVANGQPRTHRPWKKILVIVEGIYSMEGEVCPLAQVVELKKKYKAYLFIDEAHSIGALGKTGRGVCEQQGVDPADVDVMMGTFTKSFGSCGGYVAGDRELVNHLKRISPGHLYGGPMSPASAQQILSALRLMRGEDGSDRGARKVAQLRSNSNYMRNRLIDLGFNVLGDWDSPVMPIMVFQPGKMPALSREAFKRNVAVVVVGFPATPLMTARARICISAAHTKEDLDKALEVLGELGDLCLLKYSKRRKEVTTEYSHLISS
eukprot:jgi/Botrbrau1/405/Bobra.110_2s0055.1